MAKDNLGFVGIGRMGAPMAGRLIDAGHELIVFDTRREALRPLLARGATAAGSPREVADAAAIVLTSLPTPDVVEQVALGADGLAGGSAIRMMIDTSTTGPATAQRVAEGLRVAGIRSVDAPISGGPSGAENGTLAVMVSCPPEDLPAIEPILEVFGKVFHVGDRPGLAQIVKVANNMMSVSAILVAAEALALGVKAGVDARVMVDILNVSSGRNSATLDKFPRAVLPGTFDFGFATALSQKDVRLCCEAAEGLGVPMLAGNLARQMLAVTRARFGPDADFTSIAKVVEEWAGVEIRG
jgi:3-hydroxyisobutyrate dehydrogenase-like beta-hydroxyacid dehydrogenase